MVVRLDNSVIATRASEHLERAVRDDFVDVHVVGSARASLKYIEREVLLPAPFNQFFRRADDRLRNWLVEVAAFEMRGSGRFLDLCKRGDQRVIHAQAADLKVLERA